MNTCLVMIDVIVNSEIYAKPEIKNLRLHTFITYMYAVNLELQEILITLNKPLLFYCLTGNRLVE